MDLVTPEDFAILRKACDALDSRGINYVVGGGTAVVLYGRDRRTKDFDLFLNREVLRPAMDTLSLAGFLTTDTEKKWLYKAWQGDHLVDLIVESRGGITIDGEVMSRARMFTQYDVTFRVMGPEDVLFRKILTLTEGRPDWYDALSIIDRQRDALDWMYFLYRAQRYPRRVLSGLLFAQTELNAPVVTPRGSMDNTLYQGDAPGPVPQWVVLTLIEQITQRAPHAAYNPRRLDYRKAA